MAAETEIKIRLQSESEVTALLGRCTSLYGNRIEIFQRDEYFDTPDELLKNKDFTVRLRLMNGNIRIALKGPRNFFADKVHSRLELEFSALSEVEAREEIKRQQLIPTTIIEKRRWEFARDDLHIAIDRLPFIGSFLEVEAQSRERIRKVLNVLQVNADDAVTDNYTELLEQRLSVLGLPIRPNLHATFQKEEELYKIDDT